MPSLGTPPRLFAGEMVLRAVLDVLDRIHPSARHLVFDRAHERLSLIGPRAQQETEFFVRAHTAIDDIMQVPTLDGLAAMDAVVELTASRLGPRDRMPVDSVERSAA